MKMLTFDEWIKRQGLRLVNEEAQVTWHAPSMEEEAGEFQRTAQELSLSVYDLMTAFEKGKLTELSRSDLGRMENSDWVDMRPGDFVNLRGKADQYERQIGAEDQPGTLMHAFVQKRSLPAPIVLKIGQRLYLIAGNTRLMMAAVFNVLPKVWLVELDQKEE
jgi:hypothetical protein